jgi:hypothetical protein
MLLGGNMQKYWYASIGNVIYGMKSFDYVYGRALDCHPFSYVKDKTRALNDSNPGSWEAVIISFQEITKEEYDLFNSK